MDNYRDQARPQNIAILAGAPLGKKFGAQSASRLPWQLVVSAGHEEQSAFTRNVSASGVLFDLHDPLKVGQGIDFSLLMPGMYWVRRET